MRTKRLSSFSVRSESLHLKRVLIVFALGLTIQTAIVVLAVPGKAQIEPASRIQGCAPNCVAVTIDSIANVAALKEYPTVYTIDLLGGVISNTRFVGQLLGDGGGFGFIDFNQGEILSQDAISYTLSVERGVSPLVISTTTFTSNEGLLNQDLSVLISNTTLATARTGTLATSVELPFTLGYRFPGLTQAGTFTDTYRLVANLGTLRETTISATIVGQGLYRSIQLSDPKGFCEPLISSFVCSIPNLADLPRGVVISATIEAPDPGSAVRFLDVSGGGESLNLEFETDLQPPFIPPEPTITVPIDIRPFSKINLVNPKSFWPLPVAIFSTPELNVVDEVDQVSLHFGRTGEEDSLLFCFPRQMNSDQLLDLICLFRQRATDFQQGDTVGILTGETFSGVPIVGTDEVRVWIPRW